MTLWRELRLDGIRRFASAFLTSEAEACAIDHSEDEARLSQGCGFAAFDGTKVLGIAGLNPQKVLCARHRAEIGPFYVLPDAQGTGAGRALMAALISAARAQQIWQLDLSVAQTNARAIRFYERAGFVQTGCIPNAIIGPEGPEHDFFYVLDLRCDLNA